jgi:choline monooxygenase
MLSGFDADLPLERARSLPAEWYLRSDVFELERHRIFADSWQVVASTDQLREPGSYVTGDVAGEPIVVVRDGSGFLRAFYNVCRHRAGRVAHECDGQTDRLRCRYHGWTYDLAGNLRGVPEFDGVEDFRREDNGLVPVHVAVWGPLVFVHLGTHPPPLDQFFAPLPDRSPALQFDRLHFVARREYRLQCNWKVFVDNYLDGGYHVNSVHPGLAGSLDYANYRTEVFAHTSLQSSPLKTTGNDDIDSVRTGDRAYYWWMFPNLMLNAYAGVMDTNLVMPIDAKSCRVVFDFYFADVSPQAEEFRRRSMDVAHQIQLEDIAICEEVHRGLGSRSYSTGRFSVRREAAGYHFHRLIAARLQNDDGRPAK